MTKNQHFVPQFYLRRFTNQQNLVEVLDLNSMQCERPRGTKRICSAEFFYGIETGIPDETSQKIEEWFQKREDLIGNNLDSIVDKILNNKQIEALDKWIIALLMSMLWIRGREMRKQIHRIEKETTKWMIETEYSIQPDRLFNEYEKKRGVTISPELRKKLHEMMVNKEFEIEPNNLKHLQNFENINDFANLFYFQYWTVYISKVSSKFTTTDNPLATKFPKAKGGLYGRTFLERAHYFPLTPDIFIFATESDDAPGKPGIRLKRKTLSKGSEGKVLDLNAGMVNQAHQYIYAMNKQDLEDLLIVWKRQQELFATPEGKILKAQLDAERQE
jgi:hypothetical protein